MSLIKHTANFTTISNHILQSKVLSWKAKGLYAYLNSKPNNWNFSIERIAKESSDTVYSTENAVKELKQFGLLVQKARSKINEQNKRVFDGQEYHLYTEIKEPSGSISATPNFRHSETPPRRDSTTHNKTIINKTEYNKTENKKENTVDFEVQSKTLNSTEILNINSLSNFFGLSQEEKEDMDIYRNLNTLLLFLSKKSLSISNLEEIKANTKQEDFEQNKFKKMNWGGWISNYEAKKAEQKIKQFTITKDPNFGKEQISYSKYEYLWERGLMPQENTPEFKQKFYF